MNKTNQNRTFLNQQCKKYICIVLALMTLLSLSGCKTYTCYKCDKTTSKAYYEFSANENLVMCEDCARKYWMPMDYRTYQVK